MSRTVFTVVFLANFYLAKVSINDLGNANGLNDVVAKNLEAEPITFTTVRQLDSLLTMLVRFFQPIVHGTDLPLTLFSIFMAGQLLAVHMLIIVEGMRAGNRSKIVSYTTAWGMLWQLITFGVTLPVYFLAWLWTSEIPSATSAFSFADAISIPPADGETVTTAWSLGVLLPSILAGLPRTQFFSPYFQEAALAIWQAFPLWTGILQAILPKLTTAPEARLETAETKIARFGRIYTFTLALATACHYGVVGYVVLKSESAAGVAPLEMLGQILRPTWPWSIAPMASLEKGILALLQWDMYCASLATWSWLAYMAYARAGVGQVVMDLGKAVMWSCVVGPGGAALAVVWGRDVAALRANGGKKKSG
ncbi:Epoxide hydrolase aurD [Colletotrichum sp. SAR 10_76]|nr:Epoxide hydrolase aurD [Colletotrichum sp. SAR 10_76]